jgi:fatty acid desaturase
MEQPVLTSSSHSEEESLPSASPTRTVEEPLQPASTLTADEQTKLRDLSTQSWNLELAISGVAMYAILSLPEWLGGGFDYLRYNFLKGIDPGDMNSVLPVMVYSMLRAASYVLFGAFLINFVMRAFWVGLVGLHAVYPAGIKYDNLHMSTEHTKQRLADELGPLDRYILLIDKRCNILFALAFQVAILMFTTALVYTLSMFFLLIVKPLLPALVWSIFTNTLTVLFVVYAVLYYGANHKKFRDKPLAGRIQYRLLKVMRLVYVGLYKPFSFIMYTFTSHIPKEKFTKISLKFYGVFMVVFMVEYVSDLTQSSNARSSLFNQRYLFTTRVDSLFVDQNSYDNQRPADVPVDAVSIQADVIREPYLKLFIAYPKALDTLLTQLAKEPNWPDSLSRRSLQRQYANWSGTQLNRLIQIAVNDSVIANPGFFYTHFGPTEQKGWQTVLVPHNLQTGHNSLKVSVVRPKQQEPETLADIPFWYVPEKIGQVPDLRQTTAAQPSAAAEVQKRTYLRRVLQGNAASAGSGGN